MMARECTASPPLEKRVTIGKVTARTSITTPRAATDPRASASHRLGDFCAGRGTPACTAGQRSRLGMILFSSPARAAAISCSLNSGTSFSLIVFLLQVSVLQPSSFCPLFPLVYETLAESLFQWSKARIVRQSFRATGAGHSGHETYPSPAGTPSVASPTPGGCRPACKE